jgi:hypothetical protein
MYAAGSRRWGRWLLLGCIALHNALDGTDALGAPPAQLRPARRPEVPTAPPYALRSQGATRLCACGGGVEGGRAIICLVNEGLKVRLQASGCRVWDLGLSLLKSRLESS